MTQSQSTILKDSPELLFLPLPSDIFYLATALVTCQQSAKLEWIHLKLLEAVSAQVSFK